jgi:hypothetical protein
MAGGPWAAVLPCWLCLGRGVRVEEGLETDGYRCDDCGFGFLASFDGQGLPTSKQWPPPADEVPRLREAAAAFGAWKRAPAPPTARACLVLLGTGTPSVHPIGRPTTTIGRHPERHIQILERAVASLHARVTCSITSATIAPATADTGVYVDGRSIREATELTPGQIVSIGSARLAYWP